MRVGDTVSGLLTAIVGIAIVLYAATFPPMPGQPVGPSLFPSAIGGGMVILGAALVVNGLRERTPTVEFDDWVRRPRMLVNFGAVIAAVLFYSLAVDVLGFFLAAIAFLTVLFFAFGVTRTLIAPLAIGVTMVIHYGFYSLLRVPLPWGVLEAIAW